MFPRIMMDIQAPKRTPTLWQLAWAAAMFGGLYGVSQHNYLLFHSLAELFSVVVAAGVFMVAWHGRTFLSNHYLLCLGTANLFVAGLDILHLLAFKGMGVFPAADANLPTQLWIAARLLGSLSFLLAPVFLKRRLHLPSLVAGYFAVTTLLLLSIFVWAVFPDCYVEGVGLTPFKVTSEYVVALGFGVAILLLARSRDAFAPRVRKLLIGALTVAVASELTFTAYLSVYGVANFIGHYLKIVSVFLLYRALVEIGLRQPYELLFRDLERREAGARQSRDTLRRFVENAPVAIAMLDRNMRYMAASQRWLAEYGLGTQALQGRSHYDVFPEIPARWKQVHQQALAGEVVRAEDDPFDRENGSRQWLRWEVRPWHGDDGRVGGIILFTEDITARKEAEAALRFSEEKFSKAFVGNPAAMALARLEDGVYLEVNDTYAAKMGYGRDEMIGRSAIELGIWPDIAARQRYVEELRRTGSVREWEEPFSTRSGKTMTALLSAEVLSVRGEPHILSMLVDITARKQAEAALQDANATLERRVQDRTVELSRAIEALQNQAGQLRFLAAELTLAEQRERRRLATVLHDEHQQLLVAAKLRVTLLGRVEDTRIQVASKEIVALLEEAIEHSRALTRDLSPPILQTGGLVPALSWLVGWMGEKHKLAIDVEVDPTVAPATEEITVLLFQSVRELLFNVVKHAHVDAARLTVSRRDGEVQIVVADAGVGFDPRSLQDTGTTRGFGLFSIQQRVALLGGRLEIVSAPGQGSRFTLWAPLHPLGPAGSPPLADPH